MKANELRIGNYVSNGIEIHVVDMLVNDAIGIDMGLYPESDIQPIPLTEEWLVKFGLEQYNNTNHYFYTNTKFIVKINSDTGYLFGGIDHEPVKYVHQLQNLYFALCGEELTINP